MPRSVLLRLSEAVGGGGGLELGPESAEEGMGGMFRLARETGLVGEPAIPNVASLSPVSLLGIWTGVFCLELSATDLSAGSWDDISSSDSSPGDMGGGGGGGRAKNVS
jgi:hypothetical protein